MDEFNTRDSVEFLNVAKDDFLAYPNIVHRTYPSTVYAHMESTIRPFVDKSLEVNNTILSILEAKLGLPGGTFLKYHSRDEPSGSDARVIKKPPESTITDNTTNGNNSNGNLNPKVALGAHTDFGSLSFLHNRLGGLQVLVPGSNTWQYIRPLPSHAICNIGDTLSIFSGGILRSNMHRIVPPPFPQNAFSRWSVVFFTRPGYGQILRVLKEESDVIRGVYEGMGEEERGRYEPNVTAREWHKRRKMTLRRKDMTVSVVFLILPLSFLCFCWILFCVVSDCVSCSRRRGMRVGEWNITYQVIKIRS